MPKISIIVPVYNAEKYLPECLNSLINQTYQDIEIICIDSSTDNSLNIIKEYAKQDNRIKFYYEKFDVAKARNKGLELANGKYITSIDADDYCSPDTIKTSVNIAEQTNCDILLNFVSHKTNKKPEDFSYTTPWQMFIRKDFLDKNSDIKFADKVIFGEDAVFSHKLLCLTTKIEINHKSTYFYRRYPEQTTSLIEKKSAELLNSFKLMLDSLENFYNENSLWNAKNNHFLNFLLDQPFAAYVRCNFNNEQKQEIFDLIHRIIKEHNLKDNFTNNNIKSFMFKQFFKAESYKDFEFYMLFINIYKKLKKIYKKIMRKNITDIQIVKF